MGFGVAIDFDARCEGATGGLYGQVRIYSTLTGTRVGAPGMSALSPVAPGTPLRFAVDADSSVPLEFKFIRYRMSTGAWTVIQDYSFRPVWSWTPTLGDLDDYFLQIWVRARGSTNAYDSWQAFGPFTISQSPASLVALTSDAAPPIAPGTTITWTATARGGSLRLQYQFVSYSRARARWEIVRDWSPDPVWVQTTTPLDEGENTVIVAVRSWGSDSSESFQAAHTVIAAPQDSYVLVTRPPAADLPGGRQIFFNDYTGGYLQASASNGLSITATRTLPDSYVSAAMKSPDGAVPAAGVYENAERRYPDRVAGIPALEVNTTGDPCTSPLSGRFRILELEFDPGGAVSRAAVDIEESCNDEGSAIFVAARLNSTRPLFNMFPVASNAPSTVGPGTSVTWTADASSGTGPVEYRFFRYDAQDNAWTMVRDWSTNRQFTWTPSTSDYGSFLLQVWARTVGSSVAYDDWRSSDPIRRDPQPAQGVRLALGCGARQGRTAGHARGSRGWRIRSARVSLRRVRVRDRSMVRDSRVRGLEPRGMDAASRIGRRVFRSSVGTRDGIRGGLRRVGRRSAHARTRTPAGHLGSWWRPRQRRTIPECASVGGHLVLVKDDRGRCR